ncbi:MAG: DUF1538 domain-containing protein [Clostridia bacterium]|nr:DUF1538 domain-containing protein [Clostridia bacterium]
MKLALWAKIKESLVSVLPVSIIVLVTSLTGILPLTFTENIIFALSSVALIIGIGLFNLGADLAMTPMGSYVGEGLTKSKKILLLISVCFVMGMLITVAEPDLSVLAEQVGAVLSGEALITIVGLGVGLFLVVAIVKTVLQKELNAILTFAYAAMFAFCALLIENGKSGFLPLSFDAGGVTTGPITVPFIMALGAGVAKTIGGKKQRENSFGIIALCSVGPILSVMILSLFANGDPSFPLPDYSLGVGELPYLTMENALDVLKSLILIVLFFFVLQFTALKLPKSKIIQIIIGILYTFVGLVVFLTAVSFGFMPIGYKLGMALAQKSPSLLIVFSFAIGMVVVLAEPAVHVLTKQVDEITSGGVTKLQMLVALSIGVGVSIGLSVIRIVFGFSILYYLIPGYLISIGLSFFVPPLYTAIAFDSGGVASGPLTSSFILPMAIGACVALNGEAEILSLAFGIVAMVAMTPLITIQTLGFKAIVSKKRKDAVAMKRIITADDDQIIYF